MKIKYISCDGETVEEEIIKAEFCDYVGNGLGSISDLMCTRPDGSMMEIDYCDVYEITHSQEVTEAELRHENIRLMVQKDFYSKKLAEALYTIDELTKENAELKDWRAKWEERYNSGI